MKAYSIDLRQKIVDAYSEGNISQRQLAKQFRVALSFIEIITQTVPLRLEALHLKCEHSKLQQNLIKSN